MRIVQPMKSKGPALPGLPAWYKEWLADKGKWVELKCGCIADVHIPSCVLLLTGKDPHVGCDDHGFQPIKKKTLRFKEVISRRMGIDFPDDPDPEGLFPPF